ncbi:uncharacterized protein LOC141701548 [Apium graveolens]|uniref:uncharacterized protein LOC141701548 n=1 Tax=Apium graveolens TaxID=4045 RepID=UPI003D7B4772
MNRNGLGNPVQLAVTDKENFASNSVGSQQSDIRRNSESSRTSTILSSRSHLTNSRSGKAQLNYSMQCNNIPILSCITKRSTPTKNISAYPASSNNTPIMSSRSHNASTCFGQAIMNHTLLSNNSPNISCLSNRTTTPSSVKS